MRDLKTLPNIWFYKSQEVAQHGILDLIICLNGFFIAIELKKDEKSKTTALQDYNVKKIRESGGIALVVWPEVWPDVLEKLRNPEAPATISSQQLEALL